MNKEGLPIIITTLAASLTLMLVAFFLLPLLNWPVWLLWISGVLCTISIGFVLWFFRKPNRKHIVNRDFVFSGADGEVVVVEEVDETEFLNQRCIQVSVFMSVFNVHMNFYPVGGKVIYTRHHPGKYLVAWHPKSSVENERTTTVVDTGREKILFRQIAGMVARRIVNYAREGEQVEQNAKFGFIKFGSRVDIMLPLDAEVLVKLGDKVTGGQTPLARLKM